MSCAAQPFTVLTHSGLPFSRQQAPVLTVSGLGLRREEVLTTQDLFDVPRRLYHKQLQIPVAGAPAEAQAKTMSVIQPPGA